MRCPSPWLTLLLAAAVSLAACTPTPISDGDRLLKEIRELGGSVEVDETAADKPVVAVALEDAAFSNGRLVRMSVWTELRSLRLCGTEIGDGGLKTLADFPQLRELHLSRSARITDASLPYLAALTALEDLRLDDTQVTDLGLPHLAGLANLRILHLGNSDPPDTTGMAFKPGPGFTFTVATSTMIGDVGLPNLSRLSNLEELDLRNSLVTDIGLVSLVGLKKLKRLNLANAELTDAAIRPLTALTSLERIDLSGTGVTDRGIAQLKAALPNVEVAR